MSLLISANYSVARRVAWCVAWRVARFFTVLRFVFVLRAFQAYQLWPGACEPVQLARSSKGAAGVILPNLASTQTTQSHAQRTEPSSPAAAATCASAFSFALGLPSTSVWLPPALVLLRRFSTLTLTKRIAPQKLCPPPHLLLRFFDWQS